MSFVGRMLPLWLTVATIAAFGAVERLRGLEHIPEIYSGSAFGLLVVYAAFAGGLRLGSLCFALAMGFLLVDLAIPGHVFRYDGRDVEILVGIAVTYAVALFLAAGMRRRLEQTVRLEADRAAALAVAEELQRANTELHDLAEQLQARNEQIEAVVDQRTRELAAEKALLDRIIHHAPAAVVFLDPELRIRWFNPLFAEISHQSTQALIGRPYGEVIPESDPSLAAVLETLEPRRTSGLTFAVRRGGRDVAVPMDAVYVPTRSDDGALEGVLIFAVDVSDRVEIERLQHEQIENLREVDRLKGDFINVASHELRTPLASIIGYSEFLEDRVAGPLSPDQLAFVAQIQDGARRLKRIVDDMLDFARLEAGTFTLVWQEACLVQLIEEELSSLKPQLQEACLTLDVQLASEATWVRMDPLRVGQVVLNLMTNAIKFTPPGGRVTVRSLTRDESVRVEVADTGIGIGPESVPRLFEKFFQVDPSTTRERGGAGLGLAISRAIVEAHGGAIGVESTPGQGSTFWFDLPLVPVPAETSATP